MSSAAERNARAVAENFAGTALDEGNPEARELWQKYKDVDWPEDTTPLEKIVGDVPRYGKDGIERIILRTLAAKSKEESSSDTRAEPERRLPTRQTAAKQRPASKKEISARIRELAEKHGYAIEGDGSSLLHPKRAAFREHQKKSSAAIEREQQSALEELEQLAERTARRIGGSKAFAKARGSGGFRDYDAIGRLAGEKDFLSLSERLVNDVISPGDRTARRLRQRLEREDAERDRARRAAAARELADRKARQRELYHQRLAEKISKSDDPILREIHSQPEAVAMLAHVLEEYYDEDAHETLSPERALRVPSKAFNGRSLEQRLMTEVLPRLNQALGYEGAEPETDGDSGGPAAPKEEQPSGLDPQKNPTEFTKHWIAELTKAAAEDREAGRGLGG